MDPLQPPGKLRLYVPSTVVLVVWPLLALIVILPTPVPVTVRTVPEIVIFCAQVKPAEKIRNTAIKHEIIHIRLSCILFISFLLHTH
jgi:hypothetical protein